jgi:hypothetical protein
MSTKKRIPLREIGIITGASFIGAIVSLCIYGCLLRVFPDDLPNYNIWAVGIILFVFGLFDGYFVFWRVKKLNKRQ